MECDLCGRAIGLLGPIGRWEHVPQQDVELGRSVHRFFVCIKPHPPGSLSNAPRESEGYCYDRSKHALYAGTSECDWALVSSKERR